MVLVVLAPAVVPVAGVVVVVVEPGVVVLVVLAPAVVPVAGVVVVVVEPGVVVLVVLAPAVVPVTAVVVEPGVVVERAFHAVAFLPLRALFLPLEAPYVRIHRFQ